MLDQQFDQGMHLALVDEMKIIQHQHYIFRHIGQFVDEQSGNVIRCWEPWSVAQAESGLKRIGKDALHGSRERADEGAQLVVILIQGEPDYRAIKRLYPLHQ